MLGIVDASSLIKEGPSTLKRDILFFERIAVRGGSRMIETWRTGRQFRSDEDRAFADELESLFETPFFLSIDENISAIRSRLSDAFLAEYDAVTRRAAEAVEILLSGSDDTPDTLRMSELSRHWRGLRLRAHAAAINATGGLAAANCEIPIFDLAPADGVHFGEIIHIAIDKVTLPGATCGWEAVLDLKGDKDLQDRARKLRLWSSELAKPGMTAALAAEHVSDTLADYERYMSAHNLKFVSGAVKAAVAGTAEIVEEISRMRVGKLFQRILGMRASHGELLMAEQTAPGRQLSLVTALNAKL